MNSQQRERLRVLLQKIKTFKADIKLFKQFTGSCSTNNRDDNIQLQLHSNALTSSFSNLNEIYDEIQLIDVNSATLYEEDRSNLQLSYFEAIAKAQNVIDSRPFSHSISGGANSHVSVIEPLASDLGGSTSSTRKLKIPQIPLPEFTGKIEEWLSFKDTFNTLINQNAELSNVEKLQYLKSVLKGEARRKIQIFSITDENYKKAMALLEQSYDDKRSLISRHINLLLTLPHQQKESYDGLTMIADEARKHIESLESLGIIVAPEIIVTIIENKLHKTTLEKWEETIEAGEIPNFKKMRDFIYQTTRRLAKRKQERGTSREKSPVPHKHRKIDKQTAMMITNKPCLICAGEHKIYRCETFLKLTPFERFKKIKEAKLCLNCLNSHEKSKVKITAKNCKYGFCKKCKDKHHTLLHFDSTNETA